MHEESWDRKSISMCNSCTFWICPPGHLIWQQRAKPPSGYPSGSPSKQPPPGVRITNRLFVVSRKTKLTTNNAFCFPPVLIMLTSPKFMAPFPQMAFFLLGNRLPMPVATLGGTRLPPLNGTPPNCSGSCRNISSPVRSLSELLGHGVFPPPLPS